jgi:hypothetical protein
MKSKRRVEIVIETEEFAVPRAAVKREAMWCAECGTHVWMVSPEKASAIVHVRAHTICQWAQAGSIHSRDVGGLLFVCLASLAEKCASALDKPGFDSK